MQTDDGWLKPLPQDEVILEGELGNADLIFKVGEHVKVKKGDFKILSMGKRRMVLEGLPGTRLITQPESTDAPPRPESSGR